MNPMRALAHLFGYTLVRQRRQATLDDHLKAVFASQGTDCVLDVGANRGTYGALLRDLGYRGLIVSFEPLEAVFQELSRRASGDALWQTRQMALGESDESRTMARHARSDISSLLPLNELGGRLFGNTAVSEETIIIRRGDELWSEAVPGHARSVFLKTDTQGFDMNVLRGLGKRLADVRGIQIEAAFKPIYEGMPRYGEVLAFLEQAGFSLSGVYPVSRDPSHAIIEADFVFVR
ncbi:MAG: FkbM family methyltransferase [Rhodocyclaceae bacterium]|nr:FkbM family methyltransferase [Rhodocyclaceae bacterium]